MKAYKRLMAMILCVVTILNIPSFAYATEKNGSSDYELIIENNVVTGYKGTPVNVEIPEGVVGIGEYAFCGCSSLTDVEMPEGVVSIGEYAFGGCNNLTNIKFPDSIRKIGRDAFDYTKWLEVQRAENSLVIVKNILVDGQSVVGNVTIPNNIVYIAEGAFDCCTSLESVIIPDSVTSIGQFAFYACTGLQSIQIPDSVTNIGSQAFVSCNSLETITIPNGVTNIEEYLFYDCSSLETIIIPSGIKSIGKNAFERCSSLKSIIIPDSVTNIGYAVFSNCSSLETVKLSSNLKEISDNVFFNCENLVEIEIPKNITEIGYQTFYGCINLIDIIIPDSVTNIGGNAFEKTKWLEKQRTENPLVIINNILIDGKSVSGDVIIPSTVTHIVESAFYYCKNLKSILIPDSVISIGTFAFIGCSNLKSITIPKSVTNIERGVFSNCNNLESVIIPDSVTSIGYDGFAGCSNLKNLIIPESVTSIGNGAFSNCSSLESIVIPDSVTNMEGGTFRNCSSLKSIILSDSLTEIKYNTFEYCTNLENIIIPNSVTSIEYAFYGCSSLKSIRILNSNCKIYDSKSTIPSSATIYGYKDSTAESYAKKYNVKFWALDRVENETLDRDNVLENGDTFTLGYYPQTRVTANALISALNACGGEWISYKYYDGTNEKSDYMKYKDVTYKGNRYRAVTFSSYRPKAGQSSNGFSKDMVYWFAYEPLTWKVIDIETGLAVCEQAIDSQAYHHTSEKTNGYYGNNYEKSDVRDWLINNFFYTSFTYEEAEYIQLKTINNQATSPEYSSVSTQDKVFLLSKGEVDNLASSERSIDGTDYAKCQGLPMNSDNYVTYWMTRTAASASYSTYYVEKRNGNYIAYYNWYDDSIGTSMGVRPAIYLDVEKWNPEINEEVSELDTIIEQQLGEIDLGTYSLKGFIVDILGYEVPLLDLEAQIQLPIFKNNFKIIEDSETVKVLIGAAANPPEGLGGNSDAYWKETYDEIKSLYKSLKGKNASTDRLYQNFRKLRGKLNKMDVEMLFDTDVFLGAYLEFEKINKSGKWELKFLEGGGLASFGTKVSLRSPLYGPIFVAFNAEAKADGTLALVDEKLNLNPQITVTPEFIISGGLGVGVGKTYLEGDIYGKLMAQIASAGETPFKAGAEIGARWIGCLFGYEILSGSLPAASVELYPNFGNEWETACLLLTPNIDASTVESYNDLINSAQPIDRNYLISAYAISEEFDNASFVRSNAYPLNTVSNVSFEDDTMLLVWIDDLGDKTTDNMGSLMYSYFDGSSWSEPNKIFEDGMGNDMPYVYSDGKYAYIVWQKATETFEENTEMSSKLQKHDLYVTVFDNETKTFKDNICVNTEENTTFEFNPIICGKNGSFQVAWAENTDNNVYQMSGENSLHIASFDKNGNLLENKEVWSGINIIMETELTNNVLYYSLLENYQINLYSYESTNALLIENINSFDYANGEIYYTDANGFYCFKNGQETLYENIGALEDFVICNNQNELVLFTTQLKEDFTKTLYYSKLSLNEENAQWSPFEVYSDQGFYIRNYSPVVLSDDSIYVAFNYLDEDLEEHTQQSHIVVEQCTNAIDIEVQYADFDDTQLSTGNLNMEIGIKNNSSTDINTVVVNVIDHNEKLVLEKTVNAKVSAFQEGEFVFEYSIPENYKNEVYSIKVLPANLSEINEANNIVQTTFECIHSISDEWTVDVEVSTGVNGVISQHCLKCDKAFNEVEIPYLKFAGASLTLHDNLAINYKVNKAFFEENLYEKPYVKFSLNGVEKIVDTYTIADDKYVFDFNDIAPNQMNDTITATLYATYNGVTYASEPVEYSVASYCYNMLDKCSADEYAKLRTLLVDLLNYGSDSQTYTDYNLGNLVNANLTEEQIAWGTSETPTLTSVMNREYATIENPSVTWLGAGLNLKDSVTMRFKLSAENIEDLIVKVTSESGEWIIASDKFAKTDGGYYVYFNGFNAGQMSEPVYVAVYDGDKIVSNTICYSIESYAYAKKDADDEKLVDLLYSMMKYGNSAYAYVH